MPPSSITRRVWSIVTIVPPRPADRLAAGEFGGDFESVVIKIRKHR
jgi:hypothetical protein